jgi:hypothetical protein
VEAVVAIKQVLQVSLVLAVVVTEEQTLMVSLALPILAVVVVALEVVALEAMVARV